jgi:hypothetical protein
MDNLRVAGLQVEIVGTGCYLPAEPPVAVGEVNNPIAMVGRDENVVQ